MVVIDNNSTDLGTIKVLNDLSVEPKVKVIFDKSPVCDQAKLANQGLTALLEEGEIRWVFPCDADEFIWCADGLDGFLSKCKIRGQLYGSISWLNNIPDSSFAITDPSSYLRQTLFYSPSPEREWQEANHFRKSFCFRHSNMEIIVGGHFFRKEANPNFFNSLSSCPHHVPESDAVIFHFELRDCGTALLRKWKDLSTRHLVSGINQSGKWGEKETRLAQLWNQYGGSKSQLYEDFSCQRKTIWGTHVTYERLQRRNELATLLSTLIQ